MSNMVSNSTEVLTNLAIESSNQEGSLAPAFSQKRLRVLLLDLWSYIPQYDRYLCESLAREDTEVTLAAVCPYQDPEYFQRNGLANDPGLLDVVAKLGIRSDNLRRVLMFVECCVNLAALLARAAFSRVQIVHVQWIPMIRRLSLETWFLRLLKAMGLKLVYTVHNVLPHDTGNKFFAVYRRIYSEMDALICHTEEAKSRLISEFLVDPLRIWIIPHGPLLHDAGRPSKAEAREVLSLPQNETVVLWHGIIRPYKGLDFLLESWRRLDPSTLQTRLIIAGTGDRELLQDVRNQVSELGLEESVRLDLRFIPDEELPAYYQASDLVVYPYKEVTASGALMTALAFQKAIVATRLPAFVEVLRDRETARLVDYGDFDALAGSLCSLILHPEERERLACAVASLDGLNSWSSIAKKTVQCYSSLFREGRGESPCS